MLRLCSRTWTNYVWRSIVHKVILRHECIRICQHSAMLSVRIYLYTKSAVVMDHNHISKTCIEFQGVSYSYGKDLVLEDITFAIEVGDYVGLLGPNGGGKTTALKLMLGLLKPTQGAVKVFGLDISEARQERAHIGYVPQRVSQAEANFPLTVYEAVSSGRTALLGMFKSLGAEDKRIIDEAIQVSGLEGLTSRRLSELSGGQRQRVYIARALAGKPQVLVLDEPTVGVDAGSQDQFYQFLKKLHDNMHLTVVLVSHDIDVVTREVHTIICVNRKLVCAGPVHNVLEGKHLSDLYGEGKVAAYHGH